MRHHSTTVAGWREWVSLPDADVRWIKAKLDTGARSSSLHAFDIEEFERQGERWVRFSVHPWQRSAVDSHVCELPVYDQREVRSSSGHSEIRYVVIMRVGLLGTTVSAEMTLTRRDEMGFRMLIGRQALRHAFLVDPGRSYVGGRPKPSVRRMNRGS